MKIKISMRNIIFIMLLNSMLFGFLCAELKLPSSIYYINDLLNLVLFIAILKTKPINKFKEYGISSILKIILCFVLFNFIGTGINLVPVQLVVWGARNTYRGLVFLIACILYISSKDIHKIFRILYRFQIFNVLVGAYQYFVLGFIQDNVGGMFGHGNGNALDIFCGILFAYYLLRYLNKKEKTIRLVFVLISGIFFAVIAEEKFIFIEFFLISIIALIITGKMSKKVVIIPVIVSGVIIGVNMFQQIFPDSKELTDINKMFQYASSSWDDSYVIPRIGAFSYIYNTFFINRPINLLFGFGMGNCDASSINLLTSDFYRNYGQLHYRWFVHQWTFLENGILGFTVFILIFITILKVLIKYKIKYEEKQQLLNLSIIITLVAIITIWYNTTLKVDECYLAYFAISCGIIAIKEYNNNKEIYK